MYLKNYFSEVLKNEKIGAIILKIKNVNMTNKILLMLLKIFKVLLPALCKLDGSYAESINYILKYCSRFSLIPTV